MIPEDERYPNGQASVAFLREQFDDVYGEYVRMLKNELPEELKVGFFPVKEIKNIYRSFTKNTEAETNYIGSDWAGFKDSILRLGTYSIIHCYSFRKELYCVEGVHRVKAYHELIAEGKLPEDFKVLIFYLPEIYGKCFMSYRFKKAMKFPLVQKYHIKRSRRKRGRAFIQPDGEIKFYDYNRSYYTKIGKEYFVFVVNFEKLNLLLTKVAIKCSKYENIARNDYGVEFPTSKEINTPDLYWPNLNRNIYI